jgi:cholinesterase
MRKTQEVLRQLALVLAGCILASVHTALAQARPYTMLFVFGDSYSDSGAGYIDSDGPTAVVYLAQRLKIPFTYFGDPKSEGKGLNFSVSGARTGEGEGKRYPHGEFLSRGMRNQVDDFIALVKNGKVKFDPAQTMFYFAGGLNDRGTIEGYTVTNIEGEIESLYAIGARRFEVALLPEKIPAFATAGTQFNPLLKTIPADIKTKHADVTIANSNWGPDFDEVMEHPAKYGIHDVTNACAGRVLKNQDSTPCGTPEDHYFYHEGHPSTAVHKAVGEMLYREALASQP